MAFLKETPMKKIFVYVILTLWLCALSGCAPKKSDRE